MCTYKVKLRLRLQKATVERGITYYRYNYYYITIPKKLYEFLWDRGISKAFLRIGGELLELSIKRYSYGKGKITRAYIPSVVAKALGGKLREGKEVEVVFE